jgi:hypothetical protein
MTVGSTFELECNAFGFPIPYINWRFNFGYICDEPRCQIKNQDGYGILTVTKVLITDMGYYTCEGIEKL